jgi:hypothetical protein
MIKAIPVINLDSIAKARSNAMLASIRQHQGSVPDAATLQTWPTAALDDAAWAATTLPELWEAGPLP